VDWIKMQYFWKKQKSTKIFTFLVNDSEIEIKMFFSASKRQIAKMRI